MNSVTGCYFWSKACIFNPFDKYFSKTKLILRVWITSVFLNIGHHDEKSWEPGKAFDLKLLQRDVIGPDDILSGIIYLELETFSKKKKKVCQYLENYEVEYLYLFMYLYTYTHIFKNKLFR